MRRIVVVLAIAALAAAPAHVGAETVEERLAALETRIEAQDVEIMLLRAKVSGLERWRVEQAKAEAPTGEADAPDAPDAPAKTPLRKWEIQGSKNMSSDARVVADLSAGSRRATEGLGRVAFNYITDRMEPGEYEAVFFLRGAVDKASATANEPALTLHAWTGDATAAARWTWRSASETTVSPEAVASRTYTGCPLRFRVSKQENIRLLVKQVAGAVVRVDRIELALLERATK
jgi:hypothetical protein